MNGERLWGRTSLKIGGAWANGRKPMTFSLRCNLPLYFDEFSFRTFHHRHEDQDPIQWSLSGSRYATGPWQTLQRTAIDFNTVWPRNTWNYWQPTGTGGIIGNTILQRTVVTSCADGRTCPGSEFPCNTTGACAGATLKCFDYINCDVAPVGEAGKQATVYCPAGAACNVRCQHQRSCDGATVHVGAGGTLALDCGGKGQ